MKNYAFILLMVVMGIFIYYGCEEEPQYDPIKIESSLIHASHYNATDGAIDITVTGGKEPYVFSWSNGASSEDLSNIGAGIYNVMVGDARGSYKTDTFTVNQPEDIIITYLKTDVSIHGGSDGAIDITVSGGIPPYQYSWSNGQTTEDIEDLEAGTYIVTVEDTTHYSKTQSITVDQPNPPAEGIDVYENVVLGAQNSVHGCCFSTSEGVVYLLSGDQAANNAASIDFLYYYGLTNNATLAAPNDPVVSGGGGGWDWTADWSVQNATLFQTLSINTTTFDNITNASQIETHVDNPIASMANQLSSGDIIGFITAAGKKGILKVVNVVESNDGTITFTVKVQK